MLTIYDLNFLHYPQFLTRASRRYYNMQIRRAARQADHIFTISHASQRDIVELLHVPPERITTRHPGVADIFKPLPATTLQQYRCRLKLPGYLPALCRHLRAAQNIAGLLEAYRCLRARLPMRRRWCWPDAGAGSSTETMQRIHQLKLGGVHSLA